MEQVVNDKIKEESNMQDEPRTKDLYLLFGEKQKRKKDMLPKTKPSWVDPVKCKSSFTSTQFVYTQPIQRKWKESFIQNVL